VEGVRPGVYIDVVRRALAALDSGGERARAA
jgi:hypothetical protein